MKISILYSGLALLAAIAAPIAKADIIFSDTINFPTFKFGPAPTSGTFTYDVTTQTFTAFSVIWDGFAFDLTSSANSPYTNGALPCLGGLTGGAASFAVLGGACTGSWTGSNIFGQPSGPYFILGDYPDFFIAKTLPPTTQNGVMAQGSFNINQAGTLLDFQGGTSSAPTLLPNGLPVGKITGTIGGLGSQDYYSLLWNGGDFSVTASITGALNDVSYVFSEGVSGACSSGVTEALNSSNGFSNTISVANLAPGQYCIGIEADSLADPGVVLTFNTPVGSTVPEPSTRLLLLAALGIVGVFYRKR